jgi:hypothetical protein
MSAPLVIVPALDDGPFRAEGRVNFGAALPELLERLGFGRWDSCTLGEVGEDTLAGRPLVVVAYAPQILWSRDALTALRSYRGPCVVEGPLPDSAGLELFGLVPDGQIEDFAGRIELVSPSSRSEPAAESRPRLRWLRRRRRSASTRDPAEIDQRVFEAALRRSPLADAPANVSPLWARSRARPGSTAREELAGFPGGALALAFLDDAVSRLSDPRRSPRQARPALSYARLFVEAARLLDESDPALAAIAPWRFETSLALLRLVSRGLELKAPLDAAETGMVLSGRAPQTKREEPDFTSLERFGPEVMELVLPATRLAALRYPEDVEEYRRLLPALEQLLLPEGIDSAGSRAWAAAGLDDSPREARGLEVKRLGVRRLAALCMWAELADVELVVMRLAEEGEEAETLELEAQRVRSMARVARYAPGSDEVVHSALRRLVGRLGESDPSAAPLALGLAAEAAASVADEDALRQVVEVAERMRDRSTGLLSIPGASAPYADPAFGACLLVAARRLLGAVPGCREELLERWRRGLGPLQRWITLDDGDTARVLLRVTDELAETHGLPVAVQRGRRIGLALPLLSWVAAECAPPPAPEGVSYEVAPATEAWDTALAVLEAAATCAGVPRRLTWPWPATLGATVVHDVRRVPPSPELKRSLAWERWEGRGCTYCFSPTDPQPRLAVLVEQLGHEVALNGEGAGRFDSGVDALHSWTGAAIAGVLGRERFRGPAEWIEAEESELAYNILSWEPSGSHPLPLGAVDGERGRARMLGLDAFHRARSADVPAALRRRDHLALPPPAASAVAHELRNRAWWAPLSAVIERTRAVNQVQAALREGVLELASSADVPALQVVIGERDGYVPCLLEGDAPEARLAPGAGAGTFALDLRGGIVARIALWSEEEALALPVLEPSAHVLAPRYASPDAIQERLEELEVGLPEELAVEADDSISRSDLPGSGLPQSGE